MSTLNITTQDNRELENVYEEIQKKMGSMGLKAGTTTNTAATQSRTLPRLGPRREGAMQVSHGTEKVTNTF